MKVSTLIRFISNSRKSLCKRGFILAELIVVLVIIVLLSAILLPLVTHYIDDAKENAEISETRSVRVTIQTMISENSVYNDGLKDIIELVEFDKYKLTDKGKERAEELLKTDIGIAENIKINEDNILIKFSYKTVNGSVIIYENGSYIARSVY